MTTRVRSFEFKPRRDGPLRSIIGRNEKELNMHHMQYLMNTYWGLESAQIARRALQARVFCENFDVTVKWFGKEKKKINRVTKMVIEEYWMPTLPDVHDHLIMFGLCPYTWKKIPKSDHVYPVVPPWGTYSITYENNRDGVIFHLYWLDGVMPEKAKNVFWVKGDTYPQNGVLRSTMATLENLCKMQMMNAEASMKAITEAANPFFVFENSPQQNRQLADDIALEEAFGRKEVFKQMGNREEMMARRNSMRNANFQQSVMETTLANHGFGVESYNGFSDFDGSMADTYADTYNKFLSRSIILDPDYKIQQSPKPAILMRMDEIWLKLSRDCASMIGFPLEFAQPMGATRSANVVGNIRFLNESVKKLRKDFRSVVRRMWLVSYGQLVFNEVELVKRRVIRQPSLAKEFQLNEQIEIEIEWPCVPEMSYEQLRQFVLDEVIDHETMSCQAAGLFGLPGSLVNCKGGKLPEQKAMELQEKQFQLQATMQKRQMDMERDQMSEAKTDPPKKKSRKREEKETARPSGQSKAKKLKGAGKTLSIKTSKIKKKKPVDEEAKNPEKATK